MSQQKILLLEDDSSLGMVLQEHLQMQGFDVTLCVDGRQGLDEYRPGEYDLCLVDIMMPQLDGLSFAREVRQVSPDVPLIFLTAKSMKEDKIEGFKAGCDDYITKPFSIEELMLRIQAVLRRGTTTSTPAPTSFQIGDYTFDSTHQTLTHGKNQRKLTTKETELLRLLCLHINETVRREVALRRIWNDEGYFAGRSMDVFISKLRKYLRDDPSVEIMGVHGTGFRLVVG